MARVRSVSVGSVSTRVHPTEVDCEVRKVDSGSDGLFIQLSTFGSANRASEPKVSQTIQLDREAAMRIRSLIEETFGN
ncbi:MAG: hypothetical protein C0444_10395 [Microbacterium sp.]|nr:hypothetical protein [Microbacterium sp.]MBA4345577.1 hypothetical protein [Microbacterium sp.]